MLRTQRNKKTGKKQFAELVENPDALGFHQKIQERKKSTPRFETITRGSPLVLYQTLHYFWYQTLHYFFIYVVLET